VQGSAEIDVGVRQLRIDGERALVLCDRLVVPLEITVGIAEADMGNGEARLDRERLLVVRN